MPWPANAAMYNFNEFSIEVNAPTQYGVYALFDSSKQLLLIDSGEVQLDLLRLAEGAEPDLCAAGPAYFSFVLASMAECEGMKRRLTYPASFDPTCLPAVKGPHREPSSTSLNRP